MTTAKTIHEQPMTASRPILDPRATRNVPDWLVYVRATSRVNVYRFADEAEAQSFTDQINGENR